MKLNMRDKAEKQQQIILAAQACFIRKGFHSTSMQDICGEAKMSAGNIYRYFESKEAIIEAFAHEELAWMTTAIQDLPSSQNHVQAILDTIYWTTSTLTQDGKAEMMAELFAEAGRNPRINAIYANFSKQLLNEGCRSLQIIEDTGDIPAGLDHQTISWFIISLIDGLVMRSIINPDFDLEKMRPGIKTAVEALLGADS